MSENSQEKNSALRKVAKSGSLVFLATFISYFLGYIIRVSLGRFLGPSGMGLVYLAIAVCGIFGTVSKLGLLKAIQHYVGYYKGKNEYGKVKGVITDSFKISFPIALIFGVILFVFSDWISTSIFNKPGLSIALKVFAFSLPFSLLTKISVSAMRGFGVIKYVIYSQKIIGSALKTSLVFIFIIAGLGIFGGSMGYVIGIIITSILAFYYLQSKVFPVLTSKIESVSLKKKLLRYSWPLMLMGLLWTLVGQIDTFMIGFLIKDSAPLGIYNAALPTSKFLNIAPAALSSLFLPIISNLLSKGKERGVKDIYKTTSKWIFYINFPILFTFLIFPDAVLNVLFGGEFVGGGVVLSVLSFGFFINSFGRLGGDIVNLKEKTKIHLINGIVAVTIDAVLNYLLIPKYGILGAGVATSITFLIYASMQVIEAYYLVRVHPFDFYFLKALVAGLVPGSLLYIFTNVYFKVTNIFLLILMFIAFLMGYSFLILIFKGLDKNDLMVLRALQRKTGFKSETIKKLIKKFS